MARKRGNSWQAGVKWPDGRYPRYSFATEALAVEWEELAKTAREAGDEPPEPSITSSTRPTFRSFFDQYRDVIWPNTSERNVASNQKALEVFIPPDTDLTRINSKMVASVTASLQRKKYRPGTINNRLSHLRSLLRYAKRLELISVTPDMPLVKMDDNSRMRFLTEDEEQALIKLLIHWGKLEDAQLVEALIDTGCRPSELVVGETKGAPIKWSEVSVSAGGTAPDVNDPATGQPKAVISLMRTKTGKYRVLPLTDRAKNAFLASKQRGDKRPFGSLTSTEVSKTFRLAADQLGMHDVVLYTCRHTCASRLVQRGGDLRRIMDWMGHNSINTTLRYAKLTPTDIFSLEALL